MLFAHIRLVNLQQNELEIIVLDHLMPVNLWLEILGQQLNLLEVFQILMLNLGPVKEVAISLSAHIRSGIAHAN